MWVLRTVCRDRSEIRSALHAGVVTDPRDGNRAGAAADAVSEAGASAPQAAAISALSLVVFARWQQQVAPPRQRKHLQQLWGGTCSDAPTTGRLGRLAIAVSNRAGTTDSPATAATSIQLQSDLNIRLTSIRKLAALARRPADQNGPMGLESRPRGRVYPQTVSRQSARVASSMTWRRANGISALFILRPHAGSPVYNGDTTSVSLLDGPRQSWASSARPSAGFSSMPLMPARLYKHTYRCAVSGM
jgi:hypothetical protein